MASIIRTLQDVHTDIVAAARNAGRDATEITLLAVSKTFPASAVVEAFDAGQRAFGENYLQEALDKMVEVARLLSEKAGRGAIEWHFIGPIQSNKTRPIAEHFDWVHSVDRLKIAERLSAQRPPGMTPLNICLQVNISGEASKSGVAPEELGALARAVATLPGLRLRGLMAIPEAAADEAGQRAPLARVRELRERLRADGLELDCLSMGMSGDMRAAIAEGATMVRIGSAIFGARSYGGAGDGGTNGMGGVNATGGAQGVEDTNAANETSGTGGTDETRGMSGISGTDATHGTNQ